MVCSASQDPVGELYRSAALGQGLSDAASNLPDEKALERKSKADERAAFSRLGVLPIRRSKASSNTGNARSDLGSRPRSSAVSGE
jgi:hypothetical protein